MNMDNTEVSYFSSECAPFEYAIKYNDDFFREMSHFDMLGHILAMVVMFCQQYVKRLVKKITFQA